MVAKIAKIRKIACAAECSSTSLLLSQVNSKLGISDGVKDAGANDLTH